MWERNPWIDLTDDDERGTADEENDAVVPCSSSSSSAWEDDSLWTSLPQQHAPHQNHDTTSDPSLLEEVVVVVDSSTTHDLSSSLESNNTTTYASYQGVYRANLGHVGWILLLVVVLSCWLRRSQNTAAAMHDKTPDDLEQQQPLTTHRLLSNDDEPWRLASGLEGYSGREVSLMEDIRQSAKRQRKLEEWKEENTATDDERFQALVQRARQQTGHTKPCPTCQTLTTKNGGCSHMYFSLDQVRKAKVNYLGFLPIRTALDKIAVGNGIGLMGITPEGYVMIPLAIRHGLPHLDMSIPSDHDMVTLPHVVLENAVGHSR